MNLFLTAQKMKISTKETADLVTFTVEILNGKPYFLCRVWPLDPVFGFCATKIF